MDARFLRRRRVADAEFSMQHPASSPRSMWIAGLGAFVRLLDLRA
jgi:hypothetical protein